MATPSSALNLSELPTLPYLTRLPWKFRPESGDIVRDVVSGAISALVTIAFCISFSALIFQGELKGGLGLGLAALLIGSAVTGTIVACLTTLPPADAGPDTPAIAVMSVLAATVSSAILAQGGSTDSAIIHVLMAISLSTLLTGIILAGLGALRLGQMLRFVPYPVIGGFLAASGWLLIAGAVQVVTGNGSDFDVLATMVSAQNGLKLLIAIGFAVGVLIMRRRWGGFVVLPITFFMATGALQLILLAFGFGSQSHWFLQGGVSSQLWWPYGYVVSGEIDWLVILSAAAEIGSVCGVTAIALLLDVSSLEVARAKSADLDREFGANGLANGVAALVGGVAGNLSLQASVLLEESGGASRLSGIFAALTIALVLLSGANVAELVPTPILAGLLIYLGFVILTQALIRSPAGRSWTDAGLAIAIMLVIVWFGYLVGVVAGMAGACLLFAFNYSRVGVVQRHLTRSVFSSNVERAIEQSQALQEFGRAIHIFWLNGFIFFGSSNRVFEYIRQVVNEQKSPRVRYVVLDCKGVPGFDTSAVLSLIKLRNYCEANDVAVVVAGLERDVEGPLNEAGFFGEEPAPKAFHSRNEALEWCEDGLLKDKGLVSDRSGEFEEWLSNELGSSVDCTLITKYFERRQVSAGTTLYQEGESSDTIDLIASGRIAIMVRGDDGQGLRLRRMAGQTVVGEMGFFRNRPRAASVVAERSGVLYTLTREKFDELMRDEPEFGAAFMGFIIRVLADRMEFANREIAALV